MLFRSGDVLGGSSLSSPVTVLAAAPCEVLLLPYERLLLSDGSPAHQRVVQNLVRTISDKYFSLSRRIDLLVMKSLRAKVAAYLLSEAARAHSPVSYTHLARCKTGQQRCKEAAGDAGGAACGKVGEVGAVHGQHTAGKAYGQARTVGILIVRCV